jgi:acyl-CoA synthetase (NDP forming)
MLDGLEAYGLFDKLGLPHAPSVAADAGVAKAPALPFSYPVAVKALSAAIAHKSDVGGVVLNVRDDAALLAAISTIKQATNVDRVLVQPMLAGLGEVLIGYRVDPDVGPTVMLAAGGLLAEILRDRSIRLAPVDLAEARTMIGEVVALKALAGYRGKPPGDLDALAQALVSLSRLAVHDGPAVTEAEINPLIVRKKGEGVVAVDALVKLA